MPPRPRAAAGGQSLLPGGPGRLAEAREAVYDDVMAKGWSAPQGSFVQSYGSDALDASGLLMLLTFFMAPDDPRTRATVDAIRSPATRGWLAADGLVYRYDPKAAPDGLPEVEGTFNMCSSFPGPVAEALTLDRRRAD